MANLHRQKMNNRIKSYLKLDNLPGVDELNARYLAYYFNEGIKDSDERNVNAIRKFLRGEFNELGLQTEPIMAEFEMKRRAYQAERKVFYKAFSGITTEN